MKNHNSRFWTNKKVLITGYRGFLGSRLTQALISLGAKITGLDIKADSEDTILNAGDYKHITPIRGSVTNFKLLKNIISENKIKVIFHLAAEAIVNECYKNPQRAFSTNICGTWNILEASRISSIPEAIIVASSDKAYGSHKELPYKENASLCGDHPYDASKSCADLLAYTYFHTYGVPVCVTRCGNIYGPGDFNFSRIVPDAIRCVLTGKTLLIRSDGKFTRDYVYVDDIVNGYILLAEKMHNLKLSGEAFNLSDENPITVLGLLKEINKLTSEKLKYKILNQAKYEIKDQYLSSCKARKILGWKPRFTLKDGLRLTLDWYQKVIDEGRV